MRDVRNGVGFALLVVVALTDIRHQADDGQPLGLLGGAGDVLRQADRAADGVLALEVLIDEALVDDRDLPSRSAIVVGERAPAQQRHADHVEVARPDAQHRHFRQAIAGSGRAAIDFELSHGAAAERDRRCGRRRFDGGDRREVVVDPLQEPRAIFPAGVLGGRDDHARS